MSKQKKPSGMSRRDFIALAGGTAGLAAMTAMGISMHEHENQGEIPKVNPDQIAQTRHETDLLVVGSGIAGLFAAVKGHDAGARVVMVSKGRLGTSGQTPFAKGIFAFDPAKEEMTLDQFVAAVSRSALGTNNPAFTRQMAEHSLDRVNELKSWGFFDSSLCGNAFRKPMDERQIPILERIMITHLIKGKGRVVGAAGFSFDDGTLHFFQAKAVVLCCGAGGFKPNGFPICDLTHDGTVMAYKIGAKVTGKEWNDGHSGQSNNAADCYNGWHGMFDRKPGVTGVEIRHDLGVDMNYRAYIKGGPVAMGPPRPDNENTQISGGPSRPAEFSENNNRPGPPPGAEDGSPGGRPAGGNNGKRGGPPPGMNQGGSSVGGASAGMAIHKAEGLVPINTDGASTIAGLYAAGDALGSYMAGGIYTQIGSSLAGSAVQGGIAAQAAAKYCRKVTFAKISAQRQTAIRKEVLAPLMRDKGYSPSWVTQTLQGIMIPNFVLYIKKENMMQAALCYIEELRDHHLPMLRANDLHELRLAHETANMIINAEMKLKASIMRKESRCSHYRLDYPEIDTKNWNAWINIYQGKNGEMKLEKQPFATWPV